MYVHAKEVSKVFIYGSFSHQKGSVFSSEICVFDQ